jgi:predicted nucleic acid-binding protein
MKRLDCSGSSGLRFWSAIGGGCDVLYSEDMQHGCSIAGLSIVNPFPKSAA